MPLPMVVDRSRNCRSSALMVAPRSCTRSMIAMPSSIDLVARSHSANTSTSPGLSALMILIAAFGCVSLGIASRLEQQFSSNAKRPCHIGALAAVIFTAVPAHAAQLDGTTMSWPWALPFFGILLSIATGPLLFSHLWHRHYGKIAAAWAALALGAVTA